jgi:hypothetical protein
MPVTFTWQTQDMTPAAQRERYYNPAVGPRVRSAVIDGRRLFVRQLSVVASVLRPFGPRRCRDGGTRLGTVMASIWLSGAAQPVGFPEVELG